MKFWFNDKDLYHYLGYILTIKDNSLSTLRGILENSDCKKDAFKKWTLDTIIENLKDIKINELTYEKNKPELHKVFLLHNVIATKNTNTAQKSKFPFNLYKKIQNDGGWSIEHIHAQQSKGMKDEKSIRKWLGDTYKAIENITTIEKESKVEDENGNANEVIEFVTIDEEIKKEIKDLLESDKINPEEFNILKDRLIKFFESDSLHELDNLALLSKRDNSSLNNALFPVKRNRIIQMEKEGKYVPLTTKNVFLKYYNDSDLQPFYWSKSDKIKYVENIEVILKPYLS